MVIAITNDIVIEQRNPQYLRPHPSALLIPMSDSDVKALHEDIALHGINHAIDITPDGRILDGIHRWEIAQKLEFLHVPIRVYTYETETEEHLHAMRANLKRRHLSEGQLAMLSLKMKPYEQELALIRMSKGGKQGADTRANVQERDDNGKFLPIEVPKVLPGGSTFGTEKSKKKSNPSPKKEGESAEKVAKKTGASTRSVYRAQTVDKASPELSAAVMQGEVSLNKAYQQVKAEENLQEVKQLQEAQHLLTDQEIMKKLDIKIQPYDVWNFSACDNRFGHDYPGRVPGQLIAHCLYFWTEQGDIVLDPMAGSGTTIDVCESLGRRVLAYDAHPCRDDITLHNLAEQGWPEGTEEAKLIFWDPPYFKKVDSGYGEQSISRFDRADYLTFFEQMASTIPTPFHGRLAFLMSDFNDDVNVGESIWFTDYVNIFTKHNWRIERYIQAPLTTQMVHADIVKKFRASKKLARLGRVLVVMSR